MKAEHASVSNLGDRPINEDSCGSQSREADHWLFAVADGLGGHGKGDEASQLAVEAAMQQFALLPVDTAPQQLLAQAFLSGQQQLAQRQQLQGCPGSMKTTLNLMLLRQNRLWIAHVGDTRTYVFRAGSQLLRTRDHSVPQMLAITGKIREKAIRHHPDRNRLLRVMGTEWETPRYELEEELILQPGDALLSCTDGFWEWLTEKEMLRTLKRAGNVREWIDRMSACVQHNGRRAKMDNNTALAVWITE